MRVTQKRQKNGHITHHVLQIPRREPLRELLLKHNDSAAEHRAVRQKLEQQRRRDLRGRETKQKQPAGNKTRGMMVLTSQITRKQKAWTEGVKPLKSSPSPKIQALSEGAGGGGGYHQMVGAPHTAFLQQRRT